MLRLSDRNEKCSKEATMDLVFVGVTLAFFALSWGLAVACGRL
jgi:hypothetical protein